MAEIFFTIHAQKTMAARGVAPRDIVDVVLHPEVSYRGRDNQPDSRVQQRGDLAAVVKRIPEGYLVITVLWRTTDDWTSDDMRNR